MKIILAFDSFKGSLTAEEAVAAAARGVLEARPDAEVVRLPLADGGEGTTEALVRYNGATWQTCATHDALMRPIQARYAIAADGRTAIMAMASAAGLTQLAETERNPLATTTYGVGEMMRHALRRGCRHIIIGIGGSATNDGGMGMLAALGVRFLDERGEVLAPGGGNLLQVARSDWSGLDLGSASIDVVCDVQNPLCGPDGAARVYAPQKFAARWLEEPEKLADAVETLDNGLAQLAAACPMASPDEPGAGAAGGLGFGLLLLGARLRKGIDVVLDAARLDQHLHHANLVITGEGKIDCQTLNGKLPLGVLRAAQRHSVPVIALAGRVEEREVLLGAGFRDVLSINPPNASLAEALRPDVARQRLRECAKDVLLSWNFSLC